MVLVLRIIKLTIDDAVKKGLNHFTIYEARMLYKNTIPHRHEQGKYFRSVSISGIIPATLRFVTFSQYFGVPNFNGSLKNDISY